MALAIGFLLVGLVGVLHHFGLRGLDRVIGSERGRPNRSILFAFGGLLTIHTIEIIVFGGAYRLLLAWGALGNLGSRYDGSWSDLVYFSGVNFSTLGSTQIEVDGPLRMVVMMQSLGGFMLLTWSATFMYSAWGRAFRE